MIPGRVQGESIRYWQIGLIGSRKSGWRGLATDNELSNEPGIASKRATYKVDRKRKSYKICQSYAKPV